MLSRKTLRKVVRGLAWLGVFSIALHLLAVLWVIAFINLGYREDPGVPPLPRLVTDPYPPQWFPDGDRIAFSHAGSIYVVDSSDWGLQLTDGNGKQRTGDDLIGLSFGPSVSPHGSRIAYAAYERAGPWWNRSESWEIVTARPDGSDRLRLTENDRMDLNPIWSHDGTRILSHKFHKTGALYAMAPDGSDESVKVVEVEVPIARVFALSPDGGHIAFVAGERGRTSVYVVNTDGSNVRRLADNADNPVSLVLAWSPDGQRIAYAKGEIRSSGESVAAGIYTIGINDSDVREIISFPGRRVDWIDNISWSPDGSEILYRTTVIAADGSAVRELPIPDGQASWSPDGSRIAVYNEVWRPWAVLYTVARDGTDARVLVGQHADGSLLAAEGMPFG